MNEKLVYLCGTITTDPKHLNWRTHVQAELFNTLGCKIRAISPVRGKSPSDWSKDGLEAIKPTIYDKGGFVDRDLRDVKRSDAIFCNFPEKLERQSLGTWWELGWADMLGKPIVVVSQLPEVVQHPFVWKRVARICSTLEEGIEYTRFLLQD